MMIDQLIESLWPFCIFTSIMLLFYWNIRANSDGSMRITKLYLFFWQYSLAILTCMYAIRPWLWGDLTAGNHAALMQQRRPFTACWRNERAVLVGIMGWMFIIAWVAATSTKKNILGIGSAFLYARYAMILGTSIRSCLLSSMGVNHSYGMTKF